MRTGVAALAAQVRAGELSAREAVAASLERIARVDPSLRAFGAVYAERALAEAEAADRALAAGEGAERPLLGVPVAVKDEMDIAGEVTSRGTGAVSRRAAGDAEVVARLRRAGAVVVGKTTMPELGLWPFTESATWGVTRNPWDVSRTPGGSSGGSAAAVAAGLVPAALAADGAGSIRIPAACCGLFGLKPSRGLVPKTPHENSEWIVYGALTRSVADAGLMLDVLAGTGTRFTTAGRAPGSGQLPPRSGRSRVRVGVSSAFPPGSVGRLDGEVALALETVAGQLGALGHEVREQPLTIRRQDGPLTVALLLRGATDSVAEVEHPERLERRTRAFARPGRLLPDGVHRRLIAAQCGLIAAAQRAFDEVDVLLTPVLARPAAAAGAMEGRGATATFLWSTSWVPFNVVWNVTGQAAASVPAGFTAGGLPLAVQLVARPGAGAEELLLGLAAELEQALPWGDRWPPLAA